MQQCKIRCACAIYECEKDDFGALRLRVRQRADTLAPAARALGGNGRLSGLDAPHPLPSLPFTRCARSSVATLLGAAARKRGCPALPVACAPASPLASLRGQSRAAALRCGGRGFAPQRPPAPWAAPDRGTGLAPAGWTPAPLRGCVARSGRRLPPALALGALGGLRLNALPPPSAPPQKHSPAAHKRRALRAQ